MLIIVSLRASQRGSSEEFKAISLMGEKTAASARGIHAAASEFSWGPVLLLAYGVRSFVVVTCQRALHVGLLSVVVERSLDSLLVRVAQAGFDLVSR